MLARYLMQRVNSSTFSLEHKNKWVFKLYNLQIVMKKKIKYLIILGAIIIFLILLLSAIFVFIKNQEDKCIEPYLTCLETCSNLPTEEKFESCQFPSCGYQLTGNKNCEPSFLKSQHPFEEQKFLSKLSSKNREKINCLDSCIDNSQPGYYNCTKACFN
jgi:hypothetical protein